MSGNLPDWPGAEGAYRHAASVLNSMVKQGHVTVIRNGRGKPIQAIPSQEMETLISAMNEGNESILKSLLAPECCADVH